jgi:hypothetical protein
LKLTIRVERMIVGKNEPGNNEPGKKEPRQK